jgi:hypothetical protein
MADNDENDPRVTPAMKATIEAFGNLPKISADSIPAIDLTQIAKIHQDALAVFPALEQQVAAYSEQFAELHRALERVVLPAQAANDQFAENAAKAMQSIAGQLQLCPEMLKGFEQIAITSRRQETLDRIGALPHSSTPFGSLDDQSNDDELKGKLELHYRGSWSDICADIGPRRHHRLRYRRGDRRCLRVANLEFRGWRRRVYSAQPLGPDLQMRDPRARRAALDRAAIGTVPVVRRSDHPGAAGPSTAAESIGGW